MFDEFIAGPPLEALRYVRDQPVRRAVRKSPGTRLPSCWPIP